MASALFIQRLCEIGQMKYENQATAAGVPVAPDSQVNEFDSSFPTRVGSQDAVGSMVGTTENPVKCLAVGIKKKPFDAVSGSSVAVLQQQQRQLF